MGGSGHCCTNTIAAKFDGMSLGMGVSRPETDEKEATYRSVDTHH